MSRPEDRPESGAIAELRDLEEEPSPGFIGGVKRSVERRQLGADALGLSWTAVRMMVREALDAVFQLLGPWRKHKGGGT